MLASDFQYQGFWAPLFSIVPFCGVSLDYFLAVFLNFERTLASARSTPVITTMLNLAVDHGACAFALRPEMFASIWLHNSRGTATSANCRMIERA